MSILIRYILTVYVQYYNLSVATHHKINGEFFSLFILHF